MFHSEIRNFCVRSANFSKFYSEIRHFYSEIHPQMCNELPTCSKMCNELPTCPKMCNELPTYKCAITLNLSSWYMEISQKTRPAGRRHIGVHDLRYRQPDRNIYQYQQAYFSNLFCVVFNEITQSLARSARERQLKKVMESSCGKDAELANYRNDLLGCFWWSTSARALIWKKSRKPCR